MGIRGCVRGNGARSRVAGGWTRALLGRALEGVESNLSPTPAFARENRGRGRRVDLHACRPPRGARGRGDAPEGAVVREIILLNPGHDLRIVHAIGRHRSRPRLPPVVSSGGAKACRGGPALLLQPPGARRENEDSGAQCASSRPRWRFEPSTERAGSVGIRSPGAAGSPPVKCGAAGDSGSSHRVRRRAARRQPWESEVSAPYDMCEFSSGLLVTKNSHESGLADSKRVFAANGKNFCGKFCGKFKHCTTPGRAISARPARFSGAISCRWRFETRSDARHRPRRGRSRPLGR